MKYNFGQLSNGKICTCGEHHGVGEWSPEKRAEVYRFQRERLLIYYTKAQKDYLDSWEARHPRQEQLWQQRHY